ncbi:hypothetical protein B0H14DRAFT_3511300 [Mycena olivaceomarginata]|nr:hypothetical protein B0H14DRAFT_3511300 [Mycena olivaceomarginata]
MDTVSLAAETLASQRREPLVSTRDAQIASSATASATTVPPYSLCEHCKKGHLSHCSHNFSVVTSSSPTSSAARADYELAREQLFCSPARVSPSQVIARLFVLSGDNSSPTPRRTCPSITGLRSSATRSSATLAELTLPTDEDLLTLIELLTHRAARAHQPTPPPEEESNWPDEGEAGPSGSK